MSQLIDSIVAEAEVLGLSGEEKTSYVKERLKEERDRLDEKEKLRLEAEREEREAQRRQEYEERKAQRTSENEEREAQRKYELEIQRLRSEAEYQNYSSIETMTGHSKIPELPAFTDGKDDMDSWLLRFERFAESCNWPKENWGTYLSTHLTGQALQCYCGLSAEEGRDYERVKEALQKTYHLTEVGYRRMFQQCKPEAGESPGMFIARVKRYLESWMKLSRTEKTFEGVRDLFIREKFLQACPSDLANAIRDMKCRGLDEVAETADTFLEERERQLHSETANVNNNISAEDQGSLGQEPRSSAAGPNRRRPADSDIEEDNYRGRNVVKCFSGTPISRLLNCVRVVASKTSKRRKR